MPSNDIRRELRQVFITNAMCPGQKSRITQGFAAQRIKVRAEMPS